MEIQYSGKTTITEQGSPESQDKGWMRRNDITERRLAKAEHTNEKKLQQSYRLGMIQVELQSNVSAQLFFGSWELV